MPAPSPNLIPLVCLYKTCTSLLMHPCIAGRGRTMAKNQKMELTVCSGSGFGSRTWLAATAKALVRYSYSAGMTGHIGIPRHPHNLSGCLNAFVMYRVRNWGARVCENLLVFFLHSA